MNGRLVRTAAVAAFLGSVAVPAPAASRYLPHLRFSVLKTPHFLIYYHQGEDRLASRLAVVVESVHETLPARMRLQAPPVTHVVLVDQDDEANGWATTLPYNTVSLAAGWPALSGPVGSTDDWLRLVFTHEYAHILQLDQSFGWARVIRTALGRSPFAFPNLFLPRWQIEGLATFEEGRSTGLGRLPAGETAAIVRDRAYTAGPEALGRVNGGLTDWPGGAAPYLEGAVFYEYLASRFGEAKLGELSRRTAGRFLYASSRAFTHVFGQSLGSLWEEFQQRLVADADTLASEAPSPRRLTFHGFNVAGPRFVDREGALVYSVQDADRFPSLMVLPAVEGEPPRKLADRFGGTRAAVHGGVVYFDQVELREDVAWRSDLFMVELARRRVVRLTQNARLVEPDVSPDGSRLVCLRIEDGRRTLALFTLTADGHSAARLTPALLPLASDTSATYGSPRWSPDGRMLALERRRLGGPSEIVVVDTASGRDTVMASSATWRNVTPSWLPDGSAVLFAADRPGKAFQIFAASVEAPGRVLQVTSVLGGATDPVVSPDGSRLVFVGSGSQGYDLFDMPLDREQWRVVDVETGAAVGAPAVVPGSVVADQPARSSPVSRYSPLPTLVPRAWLPLVDSSSGRVRAGLATDGVDVLGRHVYQASLLWRITGPAAAVDGLHTARPDWAAGYVYDRWRAAFFAGASDTTSFRPVAAPGGLARPDAELREQEARAGVALSLRHVRHAQVFQSAFALERNTLTTTGASGAFRRHALQTAWAFNSAKLYGRSISPEDGLAVAVTSEQVRAAFGADGDADAYTAELRGYRRIGDHHSVLALRAGAGVATGDLSVRRRFYLGGSSPAGALVNFGSDALRMLRGFDDTVFAGSRIAVVNVEWRRQAWRIERGFGTFPVFLRTIHAAAFADAGHVWDTRFRVRDTRAAIGFEASLDLVAGYVLPLTVTSGVAWTRDGTTNRSPAARYYVRFGRAF